MRIAALIFGILGVLGSGFLGSKWLKDMNDQKAKIDIARAVAELDPKTKESLERLDRLGNAAYGLVGGAVLGAVGCVLVFIRKGKIAAGLFLVGFAIPIALGQDGKVAIFTFGLFLAAIFAFFVKARMEKPRKRNDHIPEDTDMV